MKFAGHSVVCAVVVTVALSIDIEAVGFEAVESIAQVPHCHAKTSGIRGITVAPIEDMRLGPVGYGSAPCELAMREISHLGATWISLTPFGRMDDLNSTDVLHDFEVPVEENERRMQLAVEQARRAGLKVAIIPHVYVMSGRWRGEIDPGGSEGWDRWFDSYSSFTLRFARLAERLDVDLFSVGVEFKSSTNFHADRWRDLIAKVRQVYTGRLTYSANWDEVEQVPFWDELDLIGINAFWPLAGEPGDGLETMVERAGAVADSLEGLAYYFDRPVVFTEVGFKSAADSALAPWEWPEDCEKLRYDESYQASAYQAVFEVFSEEPWFEGMFVWKYFSDPYDETQEVSTGFSPRGKLAEGVLASWYRMRWVRDNVDIHE